jgi:4-amino-4-deoxy-L-arabinose transferase-like glycosyltransferase
MTERFLRPMTAPMIRLWPIAVAGVAIAIVVSIRVAVVETVDDRLALGPAAAGDPPDATVRVGSILLPRGGPYVLGFQSTGMAKLTIAGETIAGDGARAPGGVVTRRIVFPAQVAPLRLAAPAGTRLVWHPPGRRGEPEYVPPSSVDPRGADQAKFDDAAGTSFGDGIAALLIGAILIGLGAYSLRYRWRAASRSVALAVIGVFVVAAIVRLVDLDGAGATWDEDTNWSAGRNYVTNVVAVDASQRSWIWNYEHPPISKYIAGTGAQLADGYGPARALSALVVALGCAFVVLLGTRLYRLRVGVVAGLIAAFTPHLIAHGKIVGHEAPTILWWAMGLWLAATAHDPPPRPDDHTDRRRLALRLMGVGVVLGLAIATRFVNVLLAPAVGAILLVQAPRGARKRTIALGLTVLPIVALLVVIAVWPRMWASPFVHLSEAWERLGKQHAPEPYLGSMTANPPAMYFVRYLIVTAPAGILLCVVAWLARAAITARRHDAAEWRATGVLLVGLLAPLLVMASPVRQDGVRYVMPCLVVMSLMAAAGSDLIATSIARWKPKAERFALPAIAGVVVLYLVFTCVRIHPYYLDYYGEHVGGPDGVSAHREYETAWWGEGLDRAIDHVNKHAAPGAKVHRACVEPAHLTWFRGDLWEPVNDPSAAEWIVVYAPRTRPCPLPPDATPVLTVDARGAPLAIVYRRPPPSPPPSR